MNEHSFFDGLLKANSIDLHDGRPLWRYNINTEGYGSLKAHLIALDKNGSLCLFPQDITLYFSEWWKQEYNGGTPSRELIYDSLGLKNTAKADFYSAAKRGAEKLGLRWIKRENTLYLRTMLTQGGLPIKHITNNSSAYTNFLEKVLEVRPNSIYDFCNDFEICRLLPVSSRNKDIYESCLQIIQAIWNGNETALIVLNQRNELRSIKSKLEQKKSEIQNIAQRRQVNLQLQWVLKKSHNTNEWEIKFSLEFAEFIANENLRILLNIGNEISLDSEYKLIINNQLLCRVKRTGDGNYRAFWLPGNGAITKWDGTQGRPEMYFQTNTGQQYRFNTKGADYPNLDEPTLWAQRNETEWGLCQGHSCAQESGLVLCPAEWTFENNSETITYFGKEFKIVTFDNAITFKKGEEEHTFKTSSLAFDWYIVENKPKWILKANMPIVQSLPQIFVYNNKGERITNITLQWRVYGTQSWQTWRVLDLPVGCIEYKIEALDTSEIGVFFNVGDFRIQVVTRTSEKAILAGNNAKLSFEFSETELLSVSEIRQGKEICIINQRLVPTEITTRFAAPNQRRGLLASIVAPFEGVRIVDANGAVLNSNSVLVFGDLFGIRVIATAINNKIIKLFNTNRIDIIIRKPLYSNINSIKEFEDVAFRLFRLTDAMKIDSSVTLQICDEDDNILAACTLKNHNALAKRIIEDEEVRVIVPNIADVFDIFAIPVDCRPDLITPIPFIQHGGYWKISEEADFQISKCILFSYNARNSFLLLPHFITLNTNVECGQITQEERTLRLKNSLLEQKSDETHWKRLYKYVQLANRYQIPFTAFDYCRAIVKSPSLCAKLFCLLAINDESDAFYLVCRDFEDDMIFAFHWIQSKYWAEAIEWIVETVADEYKNEIRQSLTKKIEGFIKEGEPTDFFSQIALYIVHQKINLINCNVRQQIAETRRKLGEKVISEIPQRFPIIPKQYRDIISVTNDLHRSWSLWLSPLAVALSVSGKDESIWDDTEMAATIRGNIKYSQWLCPEWYGSAIIHSLNILSQKKMKNEF